MNKLPLFQKGQYGGINFRQVKKDERWSFFAFIFLIFIFFLIIIFRLFQLTVVKGNYYRRLAEENHIKEVVVEPQRGKILDRKGFVVAQNLKPEVDVSADRIASRRIYESQEAVSHLIGYQQIADKKDFENDNCLKKLKLADKIGKKGVEKIFECDLRGDHGQKLIEVDARGKFLKTVTVIPAEVGKTIQLAVDLELQKKAYELLANKKGVIIALKPKTGEILALVSTPSFSPQDFEDQNQTAINQYLTDKNKPLFNRATEGAYPPGSIFKPVVAIGALEEKKIDEKTVFEDTGTIKAGPLTFGNWYFLQYGKTEGMVDITRAIRRSNDIFFYKTGEALGPEKIKIWAEKFGYGKKTGIGFEESEGTLPSPFWKEENLGERWYLGDTYNFSIGQGYVLVTPLQVAAATAVFANGGYLCKPQLLKMNKNTFLECQKLPLSQKNLDLIREGMKQACSPGGTGWPLFEFKISLSQSESVKSDKTDVTYSNRLQAIATDSASLKPIATACKTGTAESHAPSGLPHAWFTVFAPYDAPEIVLTILVEEGGQGADVAGPMAKEILKAYFERSE